MQYSTIQLDVGGGRVGAAIIPPPKEVVNSVPLLVAGGWGEGIDNLMEFGTLLANQLQRTVVLIDYPRRGAPLTQGDVEVVVRHRADSLEAVANHLHANNLDVIAHSAGTLDSLEFAWRQPSRIGRIVLLTPAGFSTASLYRLGRGLIHKLLEGFTKDWLINPLAARHHNVAAMRLVLKNPRRAIQEALAVSRAHAYDRARDLKNRGVRLYLIECSGDRIFPPDPGRKDFYELFDDHTIIQDPQARHDDLIINPVRMVQTIRPFLDN